jgi:hypothetical protein
VTSATSVGAGGTGGAGPRDGTAPLSHVVQGPAAEPHCSDGARTRRDPMFATAPPAAVFLLVEVPGPWGRLAPTDSRLDHYASGRLADAAARAGVRVLLIRRPGRHVHPPDDAPRAWALVDTRPGREHVRWGLWRHEHELLDVDLDPSARPARLLSNADDAGHRRLALVCTQGRHDLCCAVRGRPVAIELAGAAAEWDVWECSHVGGDRFAANVLLLPSGEMFGGLDPGSAVRTVQAFDAGRLSLPHHRGRVGRPPVEQAALHHVAVATGEDRRGLLHVETVDGREPVWTVEVVGGGRRRVVSLVQRWSEPALLTCSSARPERARLLDLAGLADAGRA